MKYKQKSETIKKVGRIELHEYCGGSFPAEIHLLEGYSPRADGVTESGSQFLGCVRADKIPDISEFAERFFEKAEAAGLTSTAYESNDENHRALRGIMADVKEEMGVKEESRFTSKAAPRAPKSPKAHKPPKM